MDPIIFCGLQDKSGFWLSPPYFTWETFRGIEIITMMKALSSHINLQVDTGTTFDNLVTLHVTF